MTTSDDTYPDDLPAMKPAKNFTDNVKDRINLNDSTLIGAGVSAVLIPQLRSLLSDSTLAKKIALMQPTEITALMDDRDGLANRLVALLPTAERDKYAALAGASGPVASNVMLAVTRAPTSSSNAEAAAEAMGVSPPVLSALDQQTGGMASQILTSTLIRRAIPIVAGALLTPEVIAIGGTAGLSLLHGSKAGSRFPAVSLTADRLGHINQVKYLSYQAVLPSFRKLGFVLSEDQYLGLLCHTAFKESRYNTKAVNQSVQEAVVTTRVDKSGKSSFIKVSRASIIMERIRAATKAGNKKEVEALTKRYSQLSGIQIEGCTPKNLFPVGTPGDLSIPVDVVSLIPSSSSIIDLKPELLPKDYMLQSTAIGMFQLVGSNIASLSKKRGLKVLPYSAYHNDPALLSQIEADLWIAVMRSVAGIGVAYMGDSKGWRIDKPTANINGAIAARLLGPLGDLHYAPFAGLLMMLQMAWVNGAGALTNPAFRIHNPERLWDLRGVVHLDENIDDVYTTSGAASKYSKFIKTY